VRVYIALDVTRAEGRNLDGQTVRDELEGELPDSLDVEESTYDIAVLGIGASPKDLQESIKLRLSQPG
jgi:hypothetical protein